MTVTRRVWIDLTVEAGDEIVAHGAARLAVLKGLTAMYVDGEHEVLGKYKVTPGNSAIVRVRKPRAKK